MHEDARTACDVFFFSFPFFPFFLQIAFSLNGRAPLRHRAGGQSPLRHPGETQPKYNAGVLFVVAAFSTPLLCAAYKQPLDLAVQYLVDKIRFGIQAGGIYCIMRQVMSEQGEKAHYHLIMSVMQSEAVTISWRH